MRGLLKLSTDPGNPLKTKDLMGYFLNKPEVGWPFVFVGEHPVDDPNGNSVATKPVTESNTAHLSTGTDVITFKTEDAEYSLFFERKDDAPEEVVKKDSEKPSDLGGKESDGHHSQDQASQESSLRTQERDAAQRRLEALVGKQRNSAV